MPDDVLLIVPLDSLRHPSVPPLAKANTSHALLIAANAEDSAVEDVPADVVAARTSVPDANSSVNRVRIGVA